VQGKSTIDLRLIAPEVLAQPEQIHDPADPHLYQSDDEGFRGCSFRQYASQIDAYPDEHFDILLVDGRARPSCIAHGAAKVKVGGLLVLDNADRAYYLDKTGEHLGCFTGDFFAGMGPLNPSLWTTGLFTRQF